MLCTAGLSTPSVGFGGARSGESKVAPAAIKKEKYGSLFLCA